jgi:hypothetical protein
MEIVVYLKFTTINFKGICSEETSRCISQRVEGNGELAVCGGNNPKGP